MKKITIEGNKGFIGSKENIDKKLKSKFPILKGKIISCLRPSLDSITISFIDTKHFEKGDSYIAKFTIFPEENIIIQRTEFEEIIGSSQVIKNIDLVGKHKNKYYDFNYNITDLIHSPNIEKYYFFCIQEVDNIKNIVALKTKDGWENE